VADDSGTPDAAWFELAATPPMGWNSWNQVHEEVSEKVVVEAAEAMVSRGLKDAGYEYVVVDDCWQASERDASGNLVPDPARFPNGMAAVAERVHALGLKFGIYSGPGATTCAGRLGSLGHERADAELFASWGVDFLKYDWCGAGPQTAEYERPVFELMRDALRDSGRDIVYSIADYGVGQPWEWGRGTAHLWRTTFDIWPHWGSVSSLLHQQWAAQGGSGPGGWADPDMLQVGNGTLSGGENLSHMALWCVLPAPLFAGNDLVRASTETIDLLTHRGLIAINQDPLGRPARLVAVSPHTMTWVRELTDGDVVVATLNHSDDKTEARVSLSQLGLMGRYRCVDVISGADLGELNGSTVATLRSHETSVLRLSPIGRS